MNKTHNRKKMATAAMAGLGITMILGGAFAFLTDTLPHTQTVTVEWVEIIDGGDDDVHIENVNAPGAIVTELTPGETYTLVGTLESDSTVASSWVATYTGTAPGINVTIADSDADGVTDADEVIALTDPLVSQTPIAPYTSVEVADFGITFTVDQLTAVESVPTAMTFDFVATDAR